MGENLYNSDHIASSNTYVKNYDKIDWTKRVDIAKITFIKGTKRRDCHIILKKDFDKSKIVKVMELTENDGYEVAWDNIREPDYLEVRSNLFYTKK